MRNLIDLIATLNEAEDDPKTGLKDKTHTALDFDIDDGSSKGDLTGPTEAPPPAQIPGRVNRGPADIRSPGNNPEQSRRHLSDLFRNMDDAEDVVSDDEYARSLGRDPAGTPTAGEEPVPPVTPTTLPAVIRQEVFASGDAPTPRWEPKWTMVRDLPGMMKAGIRMLGRALFRQYTDIDLEDVQVMAAPFLNSDNDLQIMAKWICRNGIRDDDPQYDFGQLMPGYQPQVAVWSTAGCQFMLVQDHAGRYIYAWPGGRGVHLDGPQDEPRQLREDEAEEQAAGESPAPAPAPAPSVSSPNLSEGARVFERNDQFFVRVVEGGEITGTHGPFLTHSEARMVAESLAAVVKNDFSDDETDEEEGTENGEETRENGQEGPVDQGAPLTEAQEHARKMAILAGVIPLPKRKRGTSEADRVADEMAILAGIRR